MDDGLVAEITKHTPKWYTGRGVVIASYQILDCGAETGSHWVYQLKEADNRVCYLKVLQADVDATKYHLPREIRILSMVQHPRIQKMILQGAMNNWMLSEDAGKNVGDILESTTRLSVEESVVIGMQVSEAIEYLWSQGIMHSDVKPENIGVKINSSLQARLFDFSISAQKEELPLETDGTIVGSPLFLPPERIRVERYDVSAEVFSLGVSLYQMITGKPPLDGDTSTELLNRILNINPVSLGWHCSGIPNALDELIMGMMAKQPRDRPLIGEVKERLGRFTRRDNERRV